MSRLNKERAVPDSTRFRLLAEAAQELGEIVTLDQIDQAYQPIIRKLSVDFDAFVFSFQLGTTPVRITSGHFAEHS
jgi:hypothetical protein